MHPPHLAGFSPAVASVLGSEELYKDVFFVFHRLKGCDLWFMSCLINLETWNIHSNNVWLIWILGTFIQIMFDKFAYLEHSCKFQGCQVPDELICLHLAPGSAWFVGPPVWLCNSRWEKNTGVEMVIGTVEQFCRLDSIFFQRLAGI